MPSGVAEHQPDTFAELAPARAAAPQVLAYRLGHRRRRARVNELRRLTDQLVVMTEDVALGFVSGAPFELAQLRRGQIQRCGRQPAAHAAGCQQGDDDQLLGFELGVEMFGEGQVGRLGGREPWRHVELALGAELTEPVSAEARERHLGGDDTVVLVLGPAVRNAVGGRPRQTLALVPGQPRIAAPCALTDRTDEVSIRLGCRHDATAASAGTTAVIRPAGLTSIRPATPLRLLDSWCSRSTRIVVPRGAAVSSPETT